MKDYGNGADNRMNISIDDVILGLYIERDHTLSKIEVAKFVKRHMELTEGYTTTIVKHMKRAEFYDMVSMIIEPDIAVISASYPAFIKALFNGLIHHNINDLWHRFFNVFSLSIIEPSDLKALLDIVSDNSEMKNNLDNDRFVDSLLSCVLESLSVEYEDDSSTADKFAV